MASLTQWTWVWASSGRWWTGKPGVLQSMGLQRVGHDWATEQQKHSYCGCHICLGMSDLEAMVSGLVTFIPAQESIIALCLWHAFDAFLANHWVYSCICAYGHTDSKKQLQANDFGYKVIIIEAFRSNSETCCIRVLSGINSVPPVFMGFKLHLRCYINAK